MPTKNNVRGQQAVPGDFTAREQERLEEQHDEERREAQTRMATVSSRNAAAAEKGVFNPKDGSQLEGPEAVDDDDEDESPEGALPPPRTAGPPPPETAQTGGAGAVILLEEDEEIGQVEKVGRINMDLENVTFGHGHTYSFERGKKYRMPADLYDHLDERGYIAH